MIRCSLFAFNSKYFIATRMGPCHHLGTTRGERRLGKVGAIVGEGGGVGPFFQQNFVGRG